MIKVELENEQEENPQRKVVFNLRRYKNPTNPNDTHKLYLTARESLTNSTVIATQQELYPIRIDGKTKTITIRGGILKKLGFIIDYQENGS